MSLNGLKVRTIKENDKVRSLISGGIYVVVCADNGHAYVKSETGKKRIYSYSEIELVDHYDLDKGIGDLMLKVSNLSTLLGNIEQSHFVASTAMQDITQDLLEMRDSRDA